MQSFAKELCFVWGAPLSGQRRWMLRSAELSKPEVDVTLCFSRPEDSIKDLCQRMEQEIEHLSVGESGKAQHLYVELPSSLLHQDFELEEWIASKRDWSISFSGIISEQAHLLSDTYHELYEEFARSSQSVVILGRSVENKFDIPQWIQSKGMDFGRHVSVFEEDLWPKSLLTSHSQNLEILRQYEEEFDEIEFPIAIVDRQKIEILLRQLSQGSFGSLWGAEIILSQDINGAARCACSAYTLMAHNVYEWKSTSRARCVGLSTEVAILNLAGVGLQKNSLTQSLRDLQLLVDS